MHVQYSDEPSERWPAIWRNGGQCRRTARNGSYRKRADYLHPGPACGSSAKYHLYHHRLRWSFVRDLSSDHGYFREWPVSKVPGYRGDNWVSVSLSDRPLEDFT